MKIDIREEIDNNTILSHVVLECLKQSAIYQIADSEDYKKSGKVDIKITINGHKADLKKFIDHWQSQVDDIVKQECKKILKNEYFNVVTDKFYDISGLIDDLGDRVQKEIDDRLENWEKQFKVEDEV